MAAENGTTNGKTTGVDKDDLVMPLIDLSAFVRGSPPIKLATAQSILHAFKTSGFLYLQNHGVPPDTISAVFEKSAEFFRRPKHEKDSLAWTTAEANRGYVKPGREKVTQSADPEEIAKLRASNSDIKESMEIGRDGVPGLPNQWPDTFDVQGEEFTKTMKAFFDMCKNLHIEVMRAIALGMGLDEHFFDSFTDGGDNTLRLLHYPPVPKSIFRDNPGQVRAGEHSDYGSITLLFQDTVGGLEVKSPKGTFVRATPIENTIVVNAGDLLSRWSNGEIKSTNHRVVQPPATPGDESETYPARYSIAYFCNPNFDRYIEALPSTWEQTGKKYEGINSGEYLVQRLAATY